MTEKPDRWPRISSKSIADCRIFKVREDLCERERDGKRSGFYIIECPDWVNIIALTPEKEVVLIDQYRYGAEEVLTEIPGGIVDKGEAVELAAKRELLEETGYSSENWVYLGGSLPNPAMQNNTVHHYLAIDCVKSAETAFDEHESMVTKLTPAAEIEEMIRTGEIGMSQVVAAFYYYKLWKDRI
jgi:ADP-ribose pyrophosphatase